MTTWQHSELRFYLVGMMFVGHCVLSIILGNLVDAVMPRYVSNIFAIIVLTVYFPATLYAIFHL